MIHDILLPYTLQIVVDLGPPVLELHELLRLRNGTLAVLEDVKIADPLAG